jgi:nicotinamidase-related amidase
MHRPDPTQTALLIVDIQERLVSAMPDVGMQRMTRSLKILREATRVLGVGVQVTEQYPKGLGRSVGVVQEWLAELNQQPIEKMSFSALDQPEVLAWLQRSKVRDVVVVGMETHICVVQTVRDLCNFGYHVWVPIDGVVSRFEDHLETGLRMCERAGACLTTSESVAFDWLKCAGTDEFRAVSKAVR